MVEKKNNVNSNQSFKRDQKKKPKQKQKKINCEKQKGWTEKPKAQKTNI